MGAGNQSPCCDVGASAEKAEERMGKGREKQRYISGFLLLVSEQQDTTSLWTCPHNAGPGSGAWNPALAQQVLCVMGPFVTVMAGSSLEGATCEGPV